MREGKDSSRGPRRVTRGRETLVRGYPGNELKDVDFTTTVHDLGW